MDDKRHGQGILYLPGGASYEGAWVQNKMHGVGKYCFENVQCKWCLSNPYRGMYTKVLLRTTISVALGS